MEDKGAEKIVRLPDGSGLVCIGAGARGTVVFVGRLNFSSGMEMRDRLAAWSLTAGFGFLVFESPYEAACHRCDPGHRLDNLALPLRRLLRGLLFLADPWAWRFLNPAERRRARSVARCADSLRRAIAALPSGPLFLAGHSQGARIAALVADSVAASGLICFGYPFCHPREGKDITRTAHLAELRTPCLIVQGDHDDYGGRDAVRGYRLSPAVTVEFVATDHECQMPWHQWQAVFRRLDRFLACMACGV